MERIAVAGILSALLLPAQEHAAFDSAIKSDNSAIKPLNKLDTKMGLKAVRHAERLASVYKWMISFWR